MTVKLSRYPRVDEEELKAFLYGDKLKDSKNKTWIDNEWDYLMRTFDPPSMYKKNKDGTFTVVDNDEYIEDDED